ncbi:CHASE2 domain-containing protein [Desulfococcaceae bacterium HSG8]|nr:CHASE2 domain-containing protein [Desulfococcaceae bacterium HSG8]
MIFFRSILYRKLFNLIRIILISLVTFDFLKTFLQGPADFFNWQRSWPLGKRKRFFENLFWAAAVAALLHLAPCTKMGQQLLNETYDDLVEKDFQKTVAERGAVSDAIQLVTFDSSAYEENPGRDFWTPRRSLGKAVIRSLKLGAKVVVADIETDKPVPIKDENRAFLKLLDDAAVLAKKKDAVIILPRVREVCGENLHSGYVCRFHDLLEKHSEVIRQGTPGIFRNPSDSKVRHFRLYEKDDKGSFTLSMSVLAAVYQWYGMKKGNEILEQTRARFMRDSWREILIPAPEGSEPIRIRRQDAGSECLPARYKFRIVPDSDLLFDMKRTSAELDDTDPGSGIYYGKTIFIGSEHKEMEDIHATPVGDMHGVFLLANGMNIFLKGEQLREVSLKYKYSAQAVLIVLAAMIFLYLDFAPAALTLTAILCILHKLLSVYVFTRWGLFLDFWLMLAGIGIFENIIGFQEILEDWVNHESHELHE